MKTDLPVIRVEGTGQASAAPDTVVVELELSTEHKDYDQATSDAARKLDLLRAALPKAGMSPDRLKTKSFNIGTKNDNPGGVRTFRAYSVEHTLSLRIPFERALLGKVLSALTSTNTQAELSLYFTVADPEDLKRRVLEAAVHNARSHAEIIAHAADHRLGAIQSIQHGADEMSFRSRSAHFFEDGGACSMNLNPVDIQTSDTVKIVWELKEA